jgi:SnoaL-like domain
MTNLKAYFVGATLGLIIAAIGVAHAQRTASKTTLTPQDYLDIQQLVARYAYALDTGTDNGYAYADLFAPNGEFVGARGATKGRDALAELGRLAFVDGHKPTYGVAHFIMNHIIEPAPEGATGKEYMVLVNIGESGKPGGEFSNTGGHYEDVYTKTAQGWRFKRRQFIPVRSEPRTAR